LPSSPDHDAAIDAWISAHADELVELACELVRRPTEQTPPTGAERAGQELVAEQLATLGAEIDRFTPGEVPGLREHPAFFPTVNGAERDFTDRPNVVGTVRGSGGGRSVLFSTHIDTVPARPEGWTVADPFGGEVIGGRLYGRGAYDTKCALAAHVLAVRCLQALDVPLRGDVVIESVVDEEYGGSHGVLASRLRGHAADIAINSEPTHLDVCPAHRGGREAYLRIRGDSGMAFGGEELRDPVVDLARAINAMDAFNRERNARGPVPALYADEPGLPLYFNQITGGGSSYEEAIGTPEACQLHFWAEVHEGTTAEAFDGELLDRVRAALEPHDPDAAARVELVPTIRFLPGSSLALDHPALEVMRAAYDTVDGREFRLRGAPFACDAYVFNLHSSTPALVLGPGGGGAHAPDEYVEVADLIDLARICARFIVRWCA
jgi:acetylornithine deacetylase